MKPMMTPAVAAALVLVGACGSDTGEPAAAADGVAPLLTAATLGEQNVRSNSEYLAQAPYSEADRKNGERLAQLCRACHLLSADGGHLIGPNLAGFFGRTAGTVSDFDYSNVLLEAQFVWTPRALDAWLSQPGRFLPGNRMTFVGVGDAEDRADLIGYLLVATDE